MMRALEIDNCRRKNYWVIYRSNRVVWVNSAINCRVGCSIVTSISHSSKKARGKLQAILEGIYWRLDALL
jgi:hypothetical protein